MNTENTYAIGLYTDELAGTAASAGTAIDLANYFNVGKREIKFIVGTNWGSTVAATAETVTISLEECDTTATASFSAVAGSTVTTTAGGEEVVERNVFVTKRYVRAVAAATGAASFWGITALVLPIRRFAQ